MLGIKNNVIQHWSPILEVLEKIEQYCKINKYKEICEIGPGYIPFRLATQFIGYNESIPNYIDINIDDNPLPFKDKEMDFIYCRHTMEDIFNPVFAIKEMIRCCKSGYIETPSPLIEITKGVDANRNGYEMKYGGYIHHNSIIWSNIEKCEIYILPKLSIVIDHFLYIDNETRNKHIENPYLWNNYFIWKDKEPKVILYKNFNKMDDTRYEMNYIHLLSRAVNESIENTKYFIEYMNTIR